MCGIFGILGDIKEREEIARNMSELLKHRGPDDEDIYSDGDVLLGHRRLSIIDLEGGHQPMPNDDKTIWITFNGEIYNYQELKLELEKEGHSFHTRSDTEVLIHMYEKHGMDMIDKLNGMFAFAIWDKRTEKLFIVRDPVGIKPVYYTYDGKAFAFASEMKALVQSGLIEAELDETTIPTFMFYRYIPDERTMFKNVKKLLPGEIITVSKKGLKKDKAEVYTREIKAEKDRLHQLKELIKRSVKYRLIADVPIGAFLSGGIDSSTVTAFAQLFTEKRVNSYSVEFEQNEQIIKSELQYAKIISERFKTENHKLVVRDEDVIRDLPLICWHYDEPMGDAAVVPTFFVSKFAREKVTVVLAGEGGDEQFAGYTKYQKMLASTGSGPESRAEEYMGYISVFMPDELDKLLKSFDKKSFLKDTIDVLSLQFDEDDKDTLLKNMLVFDQKTMLTENYLMKADKMSMAHSLEERVPLLDTSILRFSSTIPSDMKIKGSTEKYILKEALKEVLPEDIVNRKKEGYGTPTRQWFQGVLGDIFRKRIESSEAFKRYFDTDYIKQLLEEHVSGASNNNTKLWNLLCFDLWYDIYMVKKEIRPTHEYSDL